MGKWKAKLVEDPATPANDDCIRLCCFSDTHRNHRRIPRKTIHPADIAICAGDFTSCGRYSNVVDFKRWLLSQPFKHRIVIAGNHEWTFDNENVPFYKDFLVRRKVQHPIENSKLPLICDEIHYLEHTSVEIEGITFFGSPYTTAKKVKPFPIYENEKEKLWNEIPINVDIVITHSPPHGILDMSTKSRHKGCTGLFDRIKKVKPSCHVFGHVHASHGIQQTTNTLFANVSVCNEGRKLAHSLTYIDLYKA